VINFAQMKRVLTFFAHPDDEILGAGGTLSRLSEEKVDIHIVIPAAGIHARKNILTERKRNEDLRILRRDSQRALEKLGISPMNIHLGNFPDNEMDSRTLLSVIHYLEKIISEVQPDLIITHHWRCTNIDHQYCHQAVVVASRPNTIRQIPVICAEIPGSTGYLKPSFWLPNLFVEITKKDLARKILAMRTYGGENRPEPHPRSGGVLKALARVRGSESGYFFAEAFMIQQCFNGRRIECPNG